MDTPRDLALFFSFNDGLFCSLFSCSLFVNISPLTRLMRQRECKKNLTNFLCILDTINDGKTYCGCLQNSEKERAS